MYPKGGKRRLREFKTGSRGEYFYPKVGKRMLREFKNIILRRIFVSRLRVVKNRKLKRVFRPKSGETQVKGS